MALMSTSSMSPVSSVGALPSVSPGNRVIPTPQPAGELAGTRFYSIVESRLQMITLLFGHGGCGKTDFIARSCPAPVALINLDRRARDTVRKIQREYPNRKIWYQELRPPADALSMDEKSSKEYGKQQLEILMNEIHAVACLAQRGDIRTIGLDTGFEVNQIFNMAISGRPDKAKDDFGKSKDMVNQQWLSLVNAVRDSGAHLVILARAKEIFLGRDGTGVYTYRGVPDSLNDAVDLTMELSIVEPPRAGGILGVGGMGGLGMGMNSMGMGASQATPIVNNPSGLPPWQLRVTKSGKNAAEYGQVYTSASWDMFGGPFVYACMRQYMGETPGSSPEDWK